MHKSVAIYATKQRKLAAFSVENLISESFGPVCIFSVFYFSFFLVWQKMNDKQSNLLFTPSENIVEQ